MRKKQYKTVKWRTIKPLLQYLADQITLSCRRDIVHLDMGDIALVGAKDCADWTYLKANMIKLGLHARWIDVAMAMVSLVSFSVMFNGKKTRVF